MNAPKHSLRRRRLDRRRQVGNVWYTRACYNEAGRPMLYFEGLITLACYPPQPVSKIMLFPPSGGLTTLPPLVRDA